MESIQNLLQRLGAGGDWTDLGLRLTAFAVVLALAWAANRLSKRYLLRGIQRFVQRSRTTWDDALMKRQVFHRLSHLAPAVVIYLLGPVVFEPYPTAVVVLQRTAQVYMLLAGLLVLDGLLSAVGDISTGFEFARKLSVRSFLQVGKLLVYFFAGIWALSVVLGKSPAFFIGGLGAMAAVLMLVFKDPLLGFVAGIQLSANHMLQVGDWIEMPSYGADGSVFDISLTTVKVRNWDMTISTIPTYALVSSSFRNWRGMSESGGRRIKRALNIDITSVGFCTPDMLDKFGRIERIAAYMERKRKELEDDNAQRSCDLSQPVNQRQLTNIGTFRAYVAAYLRNHPQIHPQMDFLIRQLPPGPQGLPLEIYVFSRDQRWANFENIQADIFDHLLAVLPEFGLRVFQYPTGADLRGDPGGGLPARHPNP